MYYNPPNNAYNQRSTLTSIFCKNTKSVKFFLNSFAVLFHAATSLYVMLFYLMAKHILYFGDIHYGRQILQKVSNIIVPMQIQTIRN